MLVCIDAGHGVETAGKCSPDKTYYEHDFNLDVAKRIKAYLNACGIDVVMTRENEHDITLSERCRICNNSKAVLLVSVHSNAATNDGWHLAEGWQAFILAKGGKAETLANIIRKHSIALLGCKDRGIFVDNLAMVRDTKCPAVIIEHGFHTNILEVKKLKDKKYRQVCARADAMGICEFLGVTFIYEQNETEKTLAQKWVQENKISDGAEPERSATRSEIWVMLHRMSKGENNGYSTKDK